MTGPFEPGTLFPTQIRVERLTDKPLEFRGMLLGSGEVMHDDRDGRTFVTRVRLFRTEGGAYIWAWDLYEAGIKDPDRSEFERADACVIPRRSKLAEQAFPDIPPVADLVWERRPVENARLSQASTTAWIEAAHADTAIGERAAENIS